MTAAQTEDLAARRLETSALTPCTTFPFSLPTDVLATDTARRIHRNPSGQRSRLRPRNDRVGQ